MKIPSFLFYLKNVKYSCLPQRSIFFIIKAYTKRKDFFNMLSKNIKTLRKSKKLSQEDIASKLNVVRQTVSKWEQGISVPDSYTLIKLSEILETPVNILLGETLTDEKTEDADSISKKLEIINYRLAGMQNAKRKKLRIFFISLCVIIAAVFIFLLIMDSPYLNWDYTDPEIAVVGVAFHAFEWLFIRIAPIVLVISVVGIVLTRKNKRVIH